MLQKEGGRRMNEALENQWEKKLNKLEDKWRKRKEKLNGMILIWDRQLAELDSQERNNESLCYQTELDLIAVNAQIDHLSEKFKSWGTDLSSLKPVRSTKDKWILAGNLCLALVIVGVSALMYFLSGNSTSKLDSLLEEEDEPNSPIIDVEFESGSHDFLRT